MQYMPGSEAAIVSYSMPCCIGESSYSSSITVRGSITGSEVESSGKPFMMPSAQKIAAAEEAAEQAIVFGGAAARLVGIVTTPSSSAAVRSTGVILLNAGVVHRVGPNRMYVTLARRLSQAGLTVLRFDHSGIGDSEPRDDRLDFNQSSVLETIAAMDWLAAERRCRSFALIGLCSGTLTAFNTALADARVTDLVLMTALLV